MAEKKDLTIEQQAGRFGRIKWLCAIMQYISVATPFITIALVNKDKYFVEYDGTKMSISLALGLALMGFAIWGITVKKLENTYVSFIIKWVIVAFIFTLLGEIINDIAVIMWFGLIGLLSAQGFEIGAKKAGNLQQEKKEAIKKAKEELDKEQAKEETVKIRIK